MRGLDDAGARRASARRGRWPSTPRSWRSSATTSRPMGRDPTDVELETLAQTWSEHCAHKTFRRRITTDDGDERPPLLDRCCAGAPTPIAAPFVRSAFVGNAGIVSFARRHDDRPQGRDPQPPVGGRAVRRRQHRRRRRDPRRARRRPPPDRRAPTCCASARPTCRSPTLPDGALHPRRIREGVIDGVADYGNKIGLPTVAGAVLYDPAYTTNPLVFCGCIGVAADRRAARPARSPATASSCSAGAPGATASAARRSPAPRWTPRPARSPGPACRSATRSPRSC